MSVGTFIKFTKVDSNYTNDDLMHGKVVSFGEAVDIPIKKGDTIVVSTVKKNQDIQDGKTYFYVDYKQVMDII
jgi:co-chaperonin GroES (HSP10)